MLEIELLRRGGIVAVVLVALGGCTSSGSDDDGSVDGTSSGGAETQGPTSMGPATSDGSSGGTGGSTGVGPDDTTADPTGDTGADSTGGEPACPEAACTGWGWQLPNVNSEGTAVAVDGIGNVVAVGHQRGTGYGYVFKHAPDGSLTWTDSYAAAGAAGAYMAAVAIDSQDRIAVGGYDIGPLFEPTPFVRRLAPDGSEQWKWTYDEKTLQQRSIVDLAIAPDDGVIGLVTFAQTSLDDVYASAIVMLDENGVEQSLVDVDFGLSARVNSMELDGAQNILVSATARDAGGDPVGARVIKLDPAGTTVWNVEIHGADVFANGMAIDAADAIFVVGTTTVPVDGAPILGPRDTYVTKVSADGVPEWTVMIATDGDELSGSIVLDVDGNVWVMGTTDGTFEGQTSGGADDFFFRKLDPDGNTLWTRQVGSMPQPAGMGFELGDALAVGCDGNVYFTAASSGNLFDMVDVLDRSIVTGQICEPR